MGERNTPGGFWDRQKTKAASGPTLEEQEQLRACSPTGGEAIPPDQWAQDGKVWDEAPTPPSSKEVPLPPQVEAALANAWAMVSPCGVGQPGSYARGHENGIADALRQIRANLELEYRRTAETTAPQLSCSAKLREIAGDLAEIASNPPNEMDSQAMTRLASQLLALAGQVSLGEDINPRRRPLGIPHGCSGEFATYAKETEVEPEDDPANAEIIAKLKATFGGPPNERALSRAMCKLADGAINVDNGIAILTHAECDAIGKEIRRLNSAVKTSAPLTNDPARIDAEQFREGRDDPHSDLPVELNP